MDKNLCGFIIIYITLLRQINEVANNMIKIDALKQLIIMVDSTNSQYIKWLQEKAASESNKRQHCQKSE